MRPGTRASYVAMVLMETVEKQRAELLVGQIKNQYQCNFLNLMIDVTKIDEVYGHFLILLKIGLIYRSFVFIARCI